MKYLFILVILFSCNKEVGKSHVSYTIKHQKEESKWRFTVEFDRNLKLNGYVSFDVTFKNISGKEVSVHQNLDLGHIINKPITYLSDISSEANTKVLFIKSKIILYDNADYVFMQK